MIVCNVTHCCSDIAELMERCVWHAGLLQWCYASIFGTGIDVIECPFFAITTLLTTSGLAFELE